MSYFIYRFGAVVFVWLLSSVSLLAAPADSVKFLSAFFGLDNRLPIQANAPCIGQSPAFNKDGLVVVFSRSIDASTMSGSDFRVVTASGDTLTPGCATLAPANESDENRTVLLVGELGTADTTTSAPPINPPVQVRVVGDLFTLATATTPALNAKGIRIDSVTALAAGPYLVYARVLPPEESCCECPAGTTQVLQVAWSGGITNPAGGEVTDTVRRSYRAVADSAGVFLSVTPFALSDTGDGDNYHELCFSTPYRLLSISLPANLVVDPNGDLNAATGVTVTQDSGTATASAPVPRPADRYSLLQNYPNPFNPVTNIQFTMKAPSQATMVITDMLGRIVSRETLNAAAGVNQYRFNGATLSSGTYFYQLTVWGSSSSQAEFIQTRKMVLIK